MEFSRLVIERRSIRRYLPRPIPIELIWKCLESARLAPSACNAQPWKFVVVDKREFISRIAKQACGGIYSINSFIKDASVLVVIVSEREGFLRKVGKYLKGTDYYLLDIGIAGEHLVLQATELGIGSCWIGWFNEKRLKQILHIPKKKRVDVMIALGYPASQPVSKPRKSMQEMVSFNSY